MADTDSASNPLPAIDPALHAGGSVDDHQSGSSRAPPADPKSGPRSFEQSQGHGSHFHPPALNPAALHAAQALARRRVPPSSGPPPLPPGAAPFPGYFPYPYPYYHPDARHGPPPMFSHNGRPVYPPGPPLRGSTPGPSPARAQTTGPGPFISRPAGASTSSTSAHSVAPGSSSARSTASAPLSANTATHTTPAPSRSSSSSSSASTGTQPILFSPSPSLSPSPPPHRPSQPQGREPRRTADSTPRSSVRTPRASSNDATPEHGAEDNDDDYDDDVQVVENSDNDADDPATQRLLFKFNCTVTVVRNDPNHTGKGAAKLIQTNKPLGCQLLSVTREGFLDYVFGAHDIRGAYKVTASGPPFQIWWSGISKGSAPSISTNKEWSEVKRQLRENKVKNVSVQFNSVECTAWLSGAATLPGSSLAHAVAPPTPYTGSMKPTMSVFSANVLAGTEQMKEITKEWWCDAHQGVCIRDKADPTSPHKTLINEHLRLWSIAKMNGHATVHEPPAGLLDGVTPTNPGRRRHVPPSNTGNDTLTAAVTALVHRSLEPPPPPHPVNPPSSPPPGALDDHLQIAINQFVRRTPSVSAAEAKQAYDALRAEGYVPASFESISVEEVVQVTSLKRGAAAALRTSIMHWHNNIEGKRKRQRTQ
ncbi:hypothetical protein EXIGLDRAFT_724273 [Exidia glandulosa HHB12029]|uniref:Uncharacterized protein n=1 Tax=Exidia glandulosa HHB12029 TaxID=1314781 RepID=A0A166BBP5_EXIGL|nr:hypothetical protein EXIGLDRAFT_724273 [Exidia glandulosa HHB12029]